MGLPGSSWFKNHSRCWAKERGTDSRLARRGMVCPGASAAAFCCSLSSRSARFAGESLASRSVKLFGFIRGDYFPKPRRDRLLDLFFWKPLQMFLAGEKTFPLSLPALQKDLSIVA